MFNVFIRFEEKKNHIHVLCISNSFSIHLKYIFSLKEAKKKGKCTEHRTRCVFEILIIIYFGKSIYLKYLLSFCLFHTFSRKHRIFFTLSHRFMNLHCNFYKVHYFHSFFFVSSSLCLMRACMRCAIDSTKRYTVF